MPRPGSRNARRPWWAELPDPELLDVRLCDLELRMEGTPLEPRLERLDRELERAGFRFRPYAWLSTDWFTPDGSTGFGIPFFLAHPRLARIERRHMFEVEGGDEEECLKLLRHEAGHALDHAYGLSRRARWRALFGPASAPYHRKYVPNPESRRYVINLDYWYAQSHPVEDFAETFAVWLRPRSRWRERYAGWPAALRKLEYVDELMREIADRPPRRRTRSRMDSLATLRFSLREYYRRKKSHYGDDDYSIYDRDLQRLFAPDGGRRAASTFLRQRRRELRERVVEWTGQYAFAVDDVLLGMIERSRELRLRLARSEREAVQDAAIVLTVHTVRGIRRRHREYLR
jgi:hypothetical protein